MKLLHPVSAREVKRTFVASDLGKKHPYVTARRMAIGMSDAQLDERVSAGYAKRLHAYATHRWYVAEFKTTEIGVWSRAGGLPSRWTRGSLAETGRLASRSLRLGTFKRMVKGRASRALLGMIKDTKPFQAESYLLPIAFKVDTGTRGRRRLKQKMKADIDDGCLRSVALAMNSVVSIRVYYGEPRS